MLWDMDWKDAIKIPAEERDKWAKRDLAKLRSSPDSELIPCTFTSCGERMVFTLRMENIIESFDCIVTRSAAHPL